MPGPGTCAPWMSSQRFVQQGGWIAQYIFPNERLGVEPNRVNFNKLQQLYLPTF